jgi:AraC family transcriptional regulator
MARILPAGQHNGIILQKWSSSRVFVCRIAYGAQTAFAEHGNERASMIIVESGCCLKRMHNKALRLSPGSTLFIPPRATQSDYFPIATTFVAAELGTPLLERVHEFDSRLVGHLKGFQENAWDFQIRLLRELAHPDDLSELVFECILLNVFAYVQRAKQECPQKPPLWLTEAKDLLHDRAFQTIRLHEIAGSVGIHPAQLSREFKRFFKVTPGVYTRRLRIEHAKQQLEFTNAAIVDVAVKHGFADQAHFSRAFRRVTGYSPGQYRRLVRSECGFRRSHALVD